MRRRRLSVLLTFLLALLPVAPAALLSCSESSPDKPRRATVPPTFGTNDIACSVQQRPPLCSPPCPVLYDVWLRCDGGFGHLALTSGKGPSQVVGAGSQISVVTFDPFGTLSSEVALDPSTTQAFYPDPHGRPPLLRIDSQTTDRTRIVMAIDKGGRYLERMTGSSFAAQSLPVQAAPDIYGVLPEGATFGSGESLFVSYVTGQDPFLSAMSIATSANAGDGGVVGQTIPLGFTNDFSPLALDQGRLSALAVDGAGNLEAFLWRRLPDVTHASLHAVIGNRDIELADIQVSDPCPPITMVRPPGRPRALAFAQVGANPTTFEIVVIDDTSYRRTQHVIAPTPNSHLCNFTDCTGACTETPNLLRQYSLVTTSDGRVWLVYVYTRVDEDVILDGVVYSGNSPGTRSCKTTSVASRTQQRIAVAEVPTDGSPPQLRWEQAFEPEGEVTVGSRAENVTVGTVAADVRVLHYFEIDPSLF